MPGLIGGEHFVDLSKGFHVSRAVTRRLSFQASNPPNKVVRCRKNAFVTKIKICDFSGAVVNMNVQIGLDVFADADSHIK